MQRFGKSKIFQTLLAEQPVHLFYRAKRGWKWPPDFLLRWYFLYQLLSRWRGRHIGLSGYTFAIQPKVRYFRTSCRIFPRCFPTAGHGERRRWVRGCNVYCGHMSQNLSTNHLNSDYSRLIKLQSFLGDRLKTCEFWLACSCTKPTKLQLLIGFEMPANLFLNFVILTCYLKLRLYNAW